MRLPSPSARVARRIRHLAGLTLALGMATAPAFSEPPAPKKTAKACIPPPAGALGRVACGLATGLGPVPTGTLVAAAPPRGAGEAARLAQLAGRLARVVGGAIGARPVADPASLDRARALAAESGHVVHLEVAIDRGQLQVTADLYRAPKTFWARVRDPAPAAIRHAFANAPVDAEIQTFLPAVPLVGPAIRKAKTSERDPIALACGDVDRNGSVEVVLVARRRIHLGRIRGERFVTHRTVHWDVLSPIAPSPLREPIGTVSVDEAGIRVGSSDRASGARLDASLAPLETTARLPWPAGGCATVTSLGIGPGPAPCGTGDRIDPRISFDFVSDAVAGAFVSRNDGSRVRILAARRLGTDRVVLAAGDGKRTEVESVGAQLAVADLDRDGQPELVSGLPTRSPKRDAVVVRTWTRARGMIERYRTPVPTGVRAVATCPAEDGGPNPTLVATADAVWVLR